MEHGEIAHQNKDIAGKVLAENFKGKTFRVYGLDLPEIREIRPTNIPTVREMNFAWITFLSLKMAQWLW